MESPPLHRLLFRQVSGLQQGLITVAGAALDFSPDFPFNLPSPGEGGRHQERGQSRWSGTCCQLQ